MNFQSIFKRETKVIIYVVSALTIVLIGAAYALFFKVRENTNNQVVQAGALIIEYKNNSDLVVAEGEENNCLHPTDDEDGNTNGCKYEFTMTNSGSLESEYKLYLIDDLSELPEGKKLLDKQYIKYSLKKQVVAEGSEPEEVKKAVVLNTLEEEKEKGLMIDSNTIGVSESIKFILTVWVDENAPTEIVGDYVRLKLNVSNIVNEAVALADILKEQAGSDENVCGDNGIVEVKHDDAEIASNPEYETLGLNFTDVENNLKMTEYRYCGENPNNYVTFNGEEAGWRIIGLVNTPEGQRIKLIRATPLEPLISWNNKSSSEGLSIDSEGSNDWGDSKLKEILNGAYYNQTSGSCPTGQNDATSPCDFSNNGLKNEAKEMIDTITWNLGGYGENANNAKSMYNYERGTTVYTGKESSTLWKGEIGLMYPSDYGYATGGGTIGRTSCLNDSLYNWKDETSQSNCAYTDWLLNKNLEQWTLSPNSSNSNNAFNVSTAGNVNNNANDTNAAVPALYLKGGVIITGGDGSQSQPYELKLK